MANPEQIKAWARSTAPRDWYGACAGLTYNTIIQNGGSSDAYGSATAAYNATRIEGHRAQDAPAGAVHYWSYFGNDWRGVRGNWGHVAIDIYGGGRSILSATRRHREQWAIGAGIISVAAQTVPGMTYLGWSMTYGRRGRLPITVPAGGNPKPLPTPDLPLPALPEEEDMSYRRMLVTIPDASGEHWFIVSTITGIALHIADQTDVDRFDRLESKDPTPNLLPSDFSQLKARYFDKINPQPQIDAVTLAAEIVRRLPDGSALTASEIADEFDRRARERLGAG